MTWPKYVLLTWLAIAVFAQFATYDKPIPTRTARALASSVLTLSAMAVLVVIA